MNCQEALSLLYDIIDREASEIDTERVREHLKQCCNCSGVYRIEGALQQFLVERLDSRREEPSPALERLRERVAEELDRVDGEQSHTTISLPFSGATRLLVAAASIVLVVLAGYYAYGLYGHPNDALELESAHEQALEMMARFENNGQTQAALNFVNDSLEVALNTQVGKYSMVGGNLVQIEGVPTGHFLYRDGGSIVSLFLRSASHRGVPEGVREDSPGFYIHSCRHCRLCYHALGKALAIAASGEADVDLRQFAFQRSLAAVAF